MVPRVVQAQAEHHALLGALVRRDPDGAEQIVRAHNQAAQTAYAAYLRRDAPPASPDRGFWRRVRPREALTFAGPLCSVLCIIYDP